MKLGVPLRWLSEKLRSRNPRVPISAKPPQVQAPRVDAAADIQSLFGKEEVYGFKRVYFYIPEDILRNKLGEYTRKLARRSNWGYPLPIFVATTVRLTTAPFQTTFGIPPDILQYIFGALSAGSFVWFFIALGFTIYFWKIRPAEDDFINDLKTTGVKLPERPPEPGS